MKKSGHESSTFSLTNDPAGYIPSRDDRTNWKNQFIENTGESESGADKEERHDADSSYDWDTWFWKAR